jgi:signal transduction histidine kinase
LSLNVLWEPRSHDVDELFRMRRVLAPARVVLALTALGSLALAPATRGGTLQLVAALLAVYTAFALAALAVTWRASVSWPLSPMAEQAIDVSAACSVALLTAGADGPVSALFLYTMLAAAYHWGVRATVATALTAIMCVALQPALHGSASASPSGFELNALTMRSIYVLVAAFLTTHVVRAEKQARGLALSAAAIMSKADVRIGLRATLAAVFHGALRMFGARRVVLVVRDPHTTRPFLWEADAAAAPSDESVRVTPLDAKQIEDYMFAPEAAAWHAVKRTGRGGEARLDPIALDRQGATMRPTDWVLPDVLSRAIGPFDRLMALDLPGDIKGRLFLVDARQPADRHAAIRLGQRLLALVAPAVHNVYLLGRVRSRAAADERARIRRELHDGIVQAIIGIQIQLHALSIRSADQSPELAWEIARIDGILRQESMQLRELMEHMKPMEVGPDDLVDELADLVGRFQRETGISARFVSKLDHVELPAWACREIARIVQEALVNVRKHSGARNVFVRFGNDVADRTLLSITDDGRGLGFAGRRAHAERKGAHVGPGVISERVRLLGGDMVVESDPERGTQLEIAVPRLRHGISQ